MANHIEIKVPHLGESITEATLLKWLKNVGEKILIDEPLLELETDKIAIEINAQANGILHKIYFKSQDKIKIGDVLGIIDTDNNQNSSDTNNKLNTADTNDNLNTADSNTSDKKNNGDNAINNHNAVNFSLSPAVRKMVFDNNINIEAIKGTGKQGRILKEDILIFIQKNHSKKQDNLDKLNNINNLNDLDNNSKNKLQPNANEEIIPMSNLRKTIAKKLKETQNAAAMLTTFNEVDMSKILNYRKKYQERFTQLHGVKLGFMSFFVKACCLGLRQIPALNATIIEEDIIYKNHYDIGIAVSTDKGLIVPVIRNAQNLNFAEIELQISQFAQKARTQKITLDEITGGTFTITNGGVFGSLLSTPILNTGQSGILGMHKIQNRPVVIDEEIVIRPMMYLALTYDHRIIDGKDAVTFLVCLKEFIENPERIALDI